MKILYVDVETTGTDPRLHAMIQYAQIIEVDGQVVSEQSFDIQPFPGAVIDPKALEVTGTNADDLFSQARLLPEAAWFEIRKTWDRVIDKFDSSDKFVLAGYNVDAFDQQFIREFIRRCTPNARWSIAGSYIGHLTMDPLPVLKWMKALGRFEIPNLKLQVVCDILGIPLEQAHDALADIRAARQLVRRLKRMIHGEHSFSLGHLMVEIPEGPMLYDFPLPRLQSSILEPEDIGHATASIQRKPQEGADDAIER